MTSNYIMGIDQSFTSCGVVILDPYDPLKLVASKIITSDKTLTVYERSWHIFKEIFQLVKEFSVEHIAIEGLAFGKCGNATRSLAILQGVLITNLLYLNELEKQANPVKKVEIVTPSCLKKYATGKGKATKKEMIEKVPPEILTFWTSKWKRQSLNDLSDAYFLAQYLKKLLFPSQPERTSSTPISVDQLPHSLS